MLKHKSIFQAKPKEANLVMCYYFGNKESLQKPKVTRRKRNGR